MGRYVSNAGQPAPRAAQPAADEGAGEDIGQRIAGQARKMFDDEIGARFGRGAGDLNRLSDALRGASVRLEGAAAGPYFEQAAEKVERFASLLQNTNSKEMVEGAQRLARERPLVFLGAAVALGIGAGRFLKSTSGSVTSESTSPSTPRLSSVSSDQAPARRSARSSRTRPNSQTRGTNHE